MKNRHKVFGIGLSRTGTTSLTLALELLGYNARHFPISWGDADKYDALTDTPVARAYKQLDIRYPNSRFIVTVREINSWLKSCRNFFYPGRFDEWPEIKQLHLDLYGCTEFDAEKFELAYHKHQNGILSYFKDRQEDLLLIDICAGEEWEKLCRFLSLHIPDTPFPHLNKSKKK